mgnify:CR=1 FL=1
MSEENAPSLRVTESDTDTGNGIEREIFSVTVTVSDNPVEEMTNIDTFSETVINSKSGEGREMLT